MNEGVREKNQRTGHETIALPGMHFSIDIEKDGFPLLTLRKIPVKMFVAEQIWFISGARKPADFLRDFTKIWDSFTNPADVVTVAYGYRWRKHFGRDQLGLLVDLLKKRCELAPRSHRYVGPGTRWPRRHKKGKRAVPVLIYRKHHRRTVASPQHGALQRHDARFSVGCRGLRAPTMHPRAKTRSHGRRVLSLHLQRARVTTTNSKRYKSCWVARTTILRYA